ncbi:hypothetical protein V1477_012402 [Vespula maculifrons]|uniref:Uncharacterized protein n=1 Tax=Vespula maculifrons TaxID=7453 RepID=A0ABD2BXF7_VESMC
MSEADGVDSGAICKRGFIHLQFAEKPEAPEAERHLGSRILDQQQNRVIDRLCQLLVQFRFEFRRVHIVDFAWNGGDTLQLVKRYKAANFDSRSSLVTNFNESTSQSLQYACSRSKREELIIEWCGGDTLARVK